ncbi:MAG: ASKHA domain-containing protein, partial [Syntrophomonadaceae bacterium]
RLTEPTEKELVLLAREERDDGVRLACQARALGPARVEIPAESLTAAQRLQVDDAAEEPGPPADAAEIPERVGLAIDIGTTKLALYLVDIDTGRTLARTGASNPQLPYGEDLISRIAFTARHPGGARVLRERLIDRLNLCVGELCAGIGIVPESIDEAVAVGNTVMHHLFAGLPVRTLGAAPYRPLRTDALEFRARDGGLRLGEHARVFLPANVAGFVGGDHLAALVATHFDAGAGTRLLVDIGTNTEMTLARGRRLVACSCPSGPAFEGAHITSGMRAAPGAIERVRIRGHAVDAFTIGRVPPVGLCGSGILDAIAEMWREAAFDRRGNFRRGAPRVQRGATQDEYLLVPARETGNRRDIVITRGDVNEIQLAKAAVRAGIEVLLRETDTAAGDVEDVVIAGAFGSYLDPGSAITAGLLPRLPPSRIRQVGNAAGAGARRMLVSASRRRAAGDVAARIEYLELAAHPAFHRGFVSAMGFES